MPRVYGKRKIYTATIESFWSAPMRRLFESIKEIPWVSLAAFSTLLGGSVLFFYFRSIGYMPSDLSALVALGGVTALATFGVLVVQTLSIFAPAWIYQMHGVEQAALNAEASRPFKLWELISLQCGGVAALFLWIAYAYYRDCEVVEWLTLTVGGVMLPFFLVALGNIVTHKGTRGARLNRLNTSWVIALFALLPFYVLYDIRGVFTGGWIDPFYLVLICWGVLVIGNSWLATSLKWQGVFLLTIYGMLVFFVVVSIAISGKSVFPTMVATTLGLRSDGPTELILPQETCKLVRDVMASEGGEPPLHCDESSSHRLRVQVLSNVGERWLIELDAKPEDQAEVRHQVRITIPATGVQRVRVVRDEAPQERRICPKVT